MARFQHLRFPSIITFFFLWRFVDSAIATLAPGIIPYLGHFSHPTTLTSYQLPHWIKGFAQFDGIFYLRIAQNGYSQFEQAFFPLYPVLIKAFSPLFGGNHLITSHVIANASFLSGLFLFSAYLKNILPPDQKKRIPLILISLIIFPTSFFFGASYTESLFFLLVVSSLYFLQKQNYQLVALFAFLASLTRFIGVFLFVPVLLLQIKNHKSYFLHLKPAVPVIAPFLGLATYMMYLWQSSGNPFAFFTSQTAFGAGRSTQFILLPQVLFRYLKILLFSEKNTAYFVAVCELGLFLLVITVLLIQLRNILRSKDRQLLGLNLFSLINILVPTLTGTLLSVPRFALLSLSFFIFLGQMKNMRIYAILASIFLLLHVLLVTLFIQGYFVA